MDSAISGKSTRGLMIAFIWAPTQLRAPLAEGRLLAALWRHPLPGRGGSAPCELLQLPSCARLPCAAWGRVVTGSYGKLPELHVWQRWGGHRQLCGVVTGSYNWLKA